MSFADKLREEQKRLGLSQAQLAELLEVSPRAIWQWRQGREPKKITAEGVLARLRAGSDFPAMAEPKSNE